MSSTRRRRGLLFAAIALVALVVGGAALWSTDEPRPTPAQPRSAQIDVLDGPDRQERVQIDATLYAPAQTPAPAVILTHGFGGDKTSVADQARSLARRGFTVLTYSSRGFGRSSGRIALNAPNYEVADARQIIDWLARQPEVLRDNDRDPKVGVTGQSYGGALSILLAGTDPRVDVIAPVATYNDLENVLLPNTASTQPIAGATPARGSSGDQGVFKKAWAGLLFSTGATSSERGPGPENWPQDTRRPTNTDESTSTRESPMCGDFTDAVCAAYREIAQTGKAGPATSDLLDAVSPKSVTRNVKAPTLLVQGTRDTLFGLEQADANARQISSAGTAVKTIWYAGGHDSDPPSPQVRNHIANWFAFHLGGPAPVPDPGTGFVYEVAGARRSNGEVPIRTIAAATYPGIRSEPTPRFNLQLQGPDTQIVNPPGGNPASTSSLPGVGGTEQSLATDWPGQVAVFRSKPTDHGLVLSGVPRTRLTVASVPGERTASQAVLFAKLYDVSPDGKRSLLGDAVSPLRVTNLAASGDPTEIEVALPGVVHSLESGHRLELAVSTTDQAYATPEKPSAYRVGLAGQRSLSVPSVPGRDADGGSIATAPLLGIGAIGLLALLIWVIRVIRRGNTVDVDRNLTDTPLMLSGVSKSYSGKVAVRNLSIGIERGRVVGLLGPNGAGKTTTLRMALGLVRPTDGEIRLFGYRVSPGVPVLSRTGSLVEASGFLPYLSGLANLQSYWASTGRPVRQARLDEVMHIAGLDESQLHQKVGTYTQGMRQRLAIAQAMLGLPELLLLDEPANRLDPPQIRQLRTALRRYADTGRTVLVSSHLLSEVEQTCTHVVVMHEGALVTSGTVKELMSAQSETTFQVDDPDRAADALYRLDGLGKVETDGELVHAELGEHSPAVAVNTLVASGIAVIRVTPRRRLEDRFLQLVGEEQD